MTANNQHFESVPSGDVASGGGAYKNEEALESEEFVQRDCPLMLKCFNRLRLKTSDATGFVYNACGSGPVIMSNIFLANALILLAKMDIGCDVEEAEAVCEGKVYGFKPSSLITLIATVTGVLSSFLLPFLGALVDYTKYRHTVGVVSSTTLVVIQAIQIGTVESTWFPMAILQAINGFVYQVVSLCQYSYLPEVQRQVDAKTMTWYTSLFYIVQFGHQALFAVLILGIDLALDLNDVVLGHVNQAANVLITGGYYYLSWHFFTQKEAKNQLKPGDTIYTAGFKQVFRTAKGLYKYYPSTVFLYFVGVLFAESAINSFTTVSITYMNEVVQMSGRNIGILFLIVLVSTIPGSVFGNWLANMTNPLIALEINVVVYIATNFAGFLNITSPEDVMITFLFGVVWGFML